MPTSIKSKTSSCLVSDQVILGKHNPSYADKELSRFEKTWPATIKRVKPVDLFGNTTTREVVSVNRYCMDPGMSKVDIWPNDANYILSYDWSNGRMDAFNRPRGLYPRYNGALTELDTELLLKIKDQKVNLSVSIAELGKSTDMVFNLARDMVSSFRKLRSGRLVREVIRDLSHPRSRASKKVAKRWLEYTYGWQPFLGDIWNLSNQITKSIQAGRFIDVIVRKRISDSLVDNGGYSGIVMSRHVLHQKIHGRYKIDSVGLKYLAELGVTNPLAVAWELVPYSFVVDWVVNVGDYLSALDALVGVTDLTVVRSAMLSRLELQDILARNGTYTKSPGKAYLSATSTKRLGASGSITPRFPSYDPHVGVGRMLNATALLRNLFK